GLRHVRGVLAEVVQVHVPAVPDEAPGRDDRVGGRPAGHEPGDHVAGQRSGGHQVPDRVVPRGREDHRTEWVHEAKLYGLVKGSGLPSYRCVNARGAVARTTTLRPGHGPARPGSWRAACSPPAPPDRRNRWYATG